MATPAELAEVRRNTSTTGADLVWTDAVVNALIDELGVLGASVHIWYGKAASYADKVKVSEAGASREYGDLHKNALFMGDKFKGLIDAESAATGPMVKKIVRT